MGLYLSRYLLTYLDQPRGALPPHAQGRQFRHTGFPRHRPRAPEPRQTPTGPLQRLARVPHYPSTPLRCDYARLRRARVPEACGNLPRRLRPRSLQGVSLYHSRMSCRHRRLAPTWSPPRLHSQDTPQASPGQRSDSLFRCAVAPQRPDPCARETVLKALSQCNKGKRKFDGPLWFETPEAKRSKQSPGQRPSAFKPVSRDGVVHTFVPRPGKLRRSTGCRGSQSARRRGARASSSAVPQPALRGTASAGNSCHGGPRSLQRGDPASQAHSQPAAR